MPQDITSQKIELYIVTTKRTSDFPLVGLDFSLITDEHRRADLLNPAY
jgi:hypothetical protein